MAEKFSMKVSGDRELIAALDALPDRLRKNVLRRAVRRACKPILATAKALVPVRYGHLRKSLSTKIVAYHRTGAVVGVIGARKDYVREVTDPVTGARRRVVPHKYAHLVEFGTQAHALGSGAKVVVHEKVDGKRVPVRMGSQHGGLHPGARAKPFLRPALATQAATALAILQVEIGRGIEQEAAKLAAKSAGGGR